MGGLDILILNHASLADALIYLWEGTEEHISKLRNNMELAFMSHALLASDAMSYLIQSKGSIGVMSSGYGKQLCLCYI